MTEIFSAMLHIAAGIVFLALLVRCHRLERRIDELCGIERE